MKKMYLAEIRPGAEFKRMTPWGAVETYTVVSRTPLFVDIQHPDDIIDGVAYPGTIERLGIMTDAQDGGYRDLMVREVYVMVTVRTRRGSIRYPARLDGWAPRELVREDNGTVW